jgi:selenide,water dikinase
LKLNIDGEALPLLPRAAGFAQEGFVTGASGRNWDSYGHDVMLPADYPLWRRHILTDPQTSGGLLIACAAAEADGILRMIQMGGYAEASIVGEMSPGSGVGVV